MVWPEVEVAMGLSISFEVVPSQFPWVSGTGDNASRWLKSACLGSN